MRSVLLSAHNPMTGPRHLGHYVSTMADWPRLQRDHELFIIVDDLIASLLYPHARSDLQSRALQTVREFLAMDVDFSRNHVCLTSMLPEVHELAFFTAASIDAGWCHALFKESFAGLLTSLQRRELGLPRHPSLSEVAYPQVHLATLAIGLQADFFQGGEEMRGYIHIMEAMVECMHGIGLRSPAFMPGRSTFLPGTDGRHMASDNAIYLSEGPQALKTKLARVQSAHVLQRWAQSIEGEDCSPSGEASEAAGKQQDSLARRVSDALEKELARFSESRLSADDVVRTLERSAIEARERLRQTLIRIKTSYEIPGFVA